MKQQELQRGASIINSIFSNRQLYYFISEHYLWIVAAWCVAYALVFAIGKVRIRLSFTICSAVVYIFLLLYITLFMREAQPSYKYELTFLWEYRVAFSVQGWRISVENRQYLKEIIDNYMLFFPVGMLLGDCFSYSKAKVDSRQYIVVHFWLQLVKIILIGMSISCAIEVSQLVFKLGWFEYDDIFNNTIGTLLGYRLCCTMQFFLIRAASLWRGKVSRDEIL